MVFRTNDWLAVPLKRSKRYEVGRFDEPHPRSLYVNGGGMPAGRSARQNFRFARWRMTQWAYIHAYIQRLQYTSTHLVRISTASLDADNNVI